MAKRNGNPKDPGYFFVNTGRGNFPVQMDSQMHRDLYNAGRLMTYDENRDQYVAPTLPEFTVSAKKNKTFLQEYVDKILQESKGAGIAETMFSVPMNAVTSLPQMALTKLLTGVMQRPSEAMNIQNPIGATLTDAILDPTNIVGGIFAKGTRLGSAANIAERSALNKLRSGAIGVAEDVSSATTRSNPIVDNIYSAANSGTSKLDDALYEAEKQRVKNLLTNYAKENYTPQAFESGLPLEQTAPEAQRVLNDFLERIQTPEGQSRLQNLGITSRKAVEEHFKDLQFSDLLNNNAYFPEANTVFLSKQGTKGTVAPVVRHEIEHAVDEAIAAEKYFEKFLGSRKYFDRSDWMTKKQGERKLFMQNSDSANKIGNPASKIAQNLSELDLLTGSDLLQSMKISGNNLASKLFKSDLDKKIRDSVAARSYFEKLHPQNIHSEKAPFLAEVQQYMMDRGIIPSKSYTNITPEMMKATWTASRVADPMHSQLRLFNIMQPSDKNFGLLASNLNRMLGVAPLGVAAYQGVNSKQFGGKINGDDGSRKPSLYKPTRSTDATAQYLEVPNKTNLYFNENDLDAFFNKYKSRQDLNGYLTDYGKDSKGEYISLYKKEGNALTDFFVKPNEYYDRIYKSDLEVVKQNRFDKSFDDLYSKKDYSGMLKQVGTDSTVKSKVDEDYETQRKWMMDYVKSEQYRSTLKNEFINSNRDLKDLDKEINSRYNRIKNVPIEEKQIHPKGYGYVRGITYLSEQNPNEINLKTGKPYDLTPSSPEGWAKVKPGTIQIDPAAKNLDKSIAIHEITHKSTESNKYLSDYARKIISDSVNKDSNPTAKDTKLNISYKYNDNPTEVHARLTELKYLMAKHGIYNPMKEKVNRGNLIKAMSNPDIKSKLDFKDLMQMLQGKGDIIQLMNTIADKETHSYKNLV